MSGFFDKFTRKKKSLKDDSSTASPSESWTDYEVSHDIGKPVQVEKVDSIKTTEEKDVSESQNITSPLKATVEVSIAADIEEAINFEIDPMDEITAQIQSEIKEAKRVKLKQEERIKVMEATNQFRRPEWTDDVLKPDE